jgi:DNA-binding transcriptional MerR regulator
MSSSLAIGDFSRATHLSVKTLRHYHRLGLLIPAEVDPDSSYRRYSTGQIPTAQVIRRFRDVEMPLDQIGAVLQAPDVDTRNALIAEHLARLEEGLVQTPRRPWCPCAGCSKAHLPRCPWSTAASRPCRPRPSANP